MEDEKLANVTTVTELGILPRTAGSRRRRKKREVRIPGGVITVTPLATWPRIAESPRRRRRRRYKQLKKKLNLKCTKKRKYKINKQANHSIGAVD